MIRKLKCFFGKHDYRVRMVYLGGFFAVQDCCENCGKLRG